MIDGCMAKGSHHCDNCEKDCRYNEKQRKVKVLQAERILKNFLNFAEEYPDDFKAWKAENPEMVKAILERIS